VAITYPIDALVSYHYFGSDKKMAPLVATDRFRLIGDSGAFSAMTQGVTIDVGEYAAWVNRWRAYLLWAASLDVIGDPMATYRNWKTLRDRHATDTIPTLHAGADTRWLDVYASEGVNFLGLGGMAGTGMAVRAFRWAVHMFRYARDRWPAVRFHLWGVTRRQFLDNLPAYSADSSGTLGEPYQYGRLGLFDSATGRLHRLLLRGGPDVYRHGPLLRNVYGVEPDEVRSIGPHNRAVAVKLATASTQQFAEWLRRRHHVTAPTYGIAADAPPGPRVHIVGEDKDLLTAATGHRKVTPTPE
jgi:hypothetical protein